MPLLLSKRSHYRVTEQEHRPRLEQCSCQMSTVMRSSFPRITGAPPNFEGLPIPTLAEKDVPGARRLRIYYGSPTAKKLLLLVHIPDR
jgi:hypothetical protein